MDRAGLALPTTCEEPLTGPAWRAGSDGRWTCPLEKPRVTSDAAEQGSALDSTESLASSLPGCCCADPCVPFGALGVVRPQPLAAVLLVELRFYSRDSLCEGARALCADPHGEHVPQARAGSRLT